MTREERKKIGSAINTIDDLLDYYWDFRETLTADDKKGISRAFVGHTEYTSNDIKEARAKHPKFHSASVQKNKERFNRKRAEVDLFAYNKNKRLDDYDINILINGIETQLSPAEIAKRMRRPLMSIYRLIKIWNKIPDSDEKLYEFKRKVIKTDGKK